jgi:ketosteroid isomerase-like protein
MSNANVVRRFEDEFKSRNNFGIVDELMSEDFVHHLPYPGVPEGRAGMMAIGKIVTGAFRDIEVSVDLVVAEGDLVADRITARGVRVETGEPAEWTENHIYRVEGGEITELWPAGGPDLG